LVLNEAIDVTRNLTEEEYSAIAINFVFKHVVLDCETLEQLILALNHFLKLFVSNLPKDNSSYEYLEAMRCISIGSFSTVLRDCMHQFYHGLFSISFTRAELLEVCCDIKIADKIQLQLTINAPGEAEHMLRFKKLGAKEIKKEIYDMGLVGTAVEGMNDLIDRLFLTPEQWKERLLGNCPELTLVENRWSTTALCRCSLTALGKAIGHSAIRSRANFISPLEMWVK